MKNIDCLTPYAKRAALKRAADNLFLIVEEPDAHELVHAVLLTAHDQIDKPTLLEWRSPAVMLVDGAPVPRGNLRGLVAAFTVLQTHQTHRGAPFPWALLFPSPQAALNGLKRAAKSVSRVSTDLEGAILRIGTRGPYLAVRGIKPLAGVTCKQDWSFTREIGVKTLLG